MELIKTHMAINLPNYSDGLTLGEIAMHTDPSCDTILRWLRESLTEPIHPCTYFVNLRQDV